MYSCFALVDYYRIKISSSFLNRRTGFRALYQSAPLFLKDDFKNIYIISSSLLKDTFKPLIQNEAQFLFVCRLLGPFLFRFYSEKPRCLLEVSERKRLEMFYCFTFAYLACLICESFGLKKVKNFIRTLILTNSHQRMSARESLHMCI